MKRVRKPGRLSQDLASYFLNTWREIQTRCTAPVRRRSFGYNTAMFKYLIGVDEAGRGPLAGPVAVGVAMVTADFDWALLPGVNDSKQLSERVREEIFTAAHALRRDGQLNFAVAMVGAGVIDRQGIVPAVNLAMRRALGRLAAVPEETLVKLDGGLKAPTQFRRQETIIKGDAKEPVIGLASIMAKVTRDRYMRRRAELAAFAPYNFATHKGYGTKAHRAAIAEFGLSSEHRQNYCKNIVVR